MNKFIVDEENGIINKIIKDKNNNYIKCIIDFYPIQVYETLFGQILREVEKAKVIFDKIEEIKNVKKLPIKEQILITREVYIEKRKQIKEDYNEAFVKPEKTEDTYETDISLNQFIDNLQKYKNNILIEKTDKILTYSRYKTHKELFEDMITNNPFLKEENFEIYYYLFNSKKLFKPDDNYILGKEENEDFINIFIDIKKNNLSFYQLLSDKENELKNKEETDEKEENKEIEEDNNKNKEKEIKDIKNKDKKGKKEKEMTKEEKKKLQEEKEKLEKEKEEEKKKEKLLKQEYEKKKKEEEKKRKEEDKKLAQL